MENKNRISSWELGCIVFNSLVYKLFTACAESYEYFGGSASWLVSILSGIIFLIILWVLLKLYPLFTNYNRHQNTTLVTTLHFVGVIYFAISLCGAIYFTCSALKTIEYISSPFWFLIIFFAIAAIATLLCGESSVYRLHSLSSIGIGASLIIISLLSLRYADFFNMTPILGKGPSSVIKGGFATLFIYSDILAVFFLPRPDDKSSATKTVMLSAALAVAVNIIVVLCISLSMPYELSGKIALPLYPLTKFSNWGKLPARLDAVYQFALITSSILYISLALRIIIENASKISRIGRRIGTSALCALLCLSLCGCYDSKEVDAKAYVIALGIDLGEGSAYRYTFQFSNPLESGGSIGAEVKANEESSGNPSSNKTVDNIVIEADNYYTALDKLKSVLSKEADISHIKVIVYSYDAARGDCLTHSRLLLSERELRPSTNICIAESAKDFLLSVNPTLDESTVRYYELFFRNYELPYAPVTELRDFVGRSSDLGFDAVVPIVSKDGLSGMGIFSNGVLMDTLSGDEVLIYKALCGELERSYLDADTFIESTANPKTDVKIIGDTPFVNIDIQIKTNAENNLSPDLKERAETLLKKTSSLSCDILGVGRYVKRTCLTQSQWEATGWDNLLPKCQFSVSVDYEKVKNRYNLQKN